MLVVSLPDPCSWWPNSQVPPHPLVPTLQVLDPQWLLEWQLRRQSEADPASLAELRDNGLSDDDAHAALAHCHGDVMRVRGWGWGLGGLKIMPCCRPSCLCPGRQAVSNR